MKKVTCVAPVNIAVIKYWGKADEDLIIPLNDSLSGTLSTDVMCAKTTILASPLLQENKFWLNGKEQSFDSPRLNNCLREVKKRASLTLPHIKWNISICSENNFPTAAGLASSAAGYACLVSALAALYEIEGDISTIARRGSGSACRSIYGGWVQWCKGSVQNESESLAKQIVPPSHWPEMRVLILVANDAKKKNPSTSGMQKTVETSTLFQHRVKNVVPQRIQKIIKAIKEKDFEKFAEITIKDSNNFHAVNLDTYPPLLYLNDISYTIIEVVHAYNNYKRRNAVAYTFDAGPNACLYLLEKDLEDFLSLVNYVFPKPNIDNVEYYKGFPLPLKNISGELKKGIGLDPEETNRLKCIIHTKIGDGPKILQNEEDHLLTDAGLPKNI